MKNEQAIWQRLADIEQRLDVLESKKLKRNELAANRQLKRLQTTRSK
jgi:hypothetical protein